MGSRKSAGLNQQPCEQRGFPLSTVGQYLEFSGDNTCYVYIHIYNPPASFPYRIGTPRCCINRFFLYRSPLNFSCPVCLVLAGSNFISKLRVLLLYFFSVLKFSDLGLQFYSRLQFYRDMCRFCMVLFSCQF